MAEHNEYQSQSTRSTIYDGDEMVTIVWMEQGLRMKLKFEVMKLTGYVTLWKK